MAYYSGVASSLSDLKNALLTHAQSDGWVLTGEVLSKAGVYFRIQQPTDFVTILGCGSNAVTSPAPNCVGIGKMYVRATAPTREITFPCTYEAFGFSQEFYFVVNYNVFNYQWIAFGKTSVPGVPGQGGWFGATIGSNLTTTCSSATAQSYYGYDFVVSLGDDGGGTSYNTTVPALFACKTFQYTAGRSSYVNHGFDGLGWAWESSSGGPGWRWMEKLNQIQPNSWNSEAALLPLRAFKARPDSKVSLVVDLDNVRMLRIDNLTPGQTITIGTDQWKVFPWYKKSSQFRSGSSSGDVTDYDNTGTYGWAIRYEAP